MECYKYRAYEIDTGKMYVDGENKNVIATNAGVFTRDTGHISNNAWIFRGKEGFIISFETGAVDRHGDGIYLGDIISCNILDIHGNRCLGIITYIHGVVGVRCLSEIKCNAYMNSSNYEKWLYFMRGCDVVGNIFQHKDLLTDYAIEIVESLGYLDSHSTTP